MKTRKKKSDSPEDRLLKENRELKALNRSLMKRIKKLDRNFKEPEESDEEPVLDDLQEDLKNHCPECARGILTINIMVNRKFSRCNLCDYKKVVKV